MTTPAPDLHLETDAPADAEYHAALEAWEADHPSGTPARRRLLEEIVRYALASRRAFRRETARRDALADRARNCWDDDRDAEAEALAAKLSRAPALTAARLRRTRHGALSLMISRWGHLAAALEQNGDWSPAQQRLALDLLGTPREFRDNSNRLGPRDAPPAETAPLRDELARQEIADLEEALAEGLEAADETDRQIAACGLATETCPIWRRTQREEERDRKRLERAWKQYFGPERKAAPAPAPAPETTPARPPTPPTREVAPAPLPPEPILSPDASTPDAPSPLRPNRQARRAPLADERQRSG